MEEPEKKPQFSVAMPAEDLAVIDDWAFANRVRARSEAIRRLVKLGLAADAAGWKPGAPPPAKRPAPPAKRPAARAKKT